MTAERLRLSIPAGEARQHELPWRDPRLGSAACLGSFEWSVVVLGELTIDLQVSARWSAGGGDEEQAHGAELGGEHREQAGAKADAEGSANLVTLQEQARGRTFRGGFDPASDKRLPPASSGSSSAGSGRIEAIVFDFDNTFSWWTAKEVELVMLRVPPPGPPPSMVVPLQFRPPMELPPRVCARPSGDLGSVLAPTLAAPAVEPQLAERRGPLDSAELLRFASVLQAALAEIEAKRPADGSEAVAAGGRWLQELLSRASGLRSLCVQARKEHESLIEQRVNAMQVIGEDETVAGAEALPTTTQAQAEDDDLGEHDAQQVALGTDAEEDRQEVAVASCGDCAREESEQPQGVGDGNAVLEQAAGDISQEYGLGQQRQGEAAEDCNDSEEEEDEEEEEEEEEEEHNKGSGKNESREESLLAEVEPAGQFNDDDGCDHEGVASPVAVA